MHPHSELDTISPLLGLLAPCANGVGQDSSALALMTFGVGAFLVGAIQCILELLGLSTKHVGII